VAIDHVRGRASMGASFGSNCRIRVGGRRRRCGFQAISFSSAGCSRLAPDRPTNTVQRLSWHHPGCAVGVGSKNRLCIRSASFTARVDHTLAVEHIECSRPCSPCLPAASLQAIAAAPAPRGTDDFGVFPRRSCQPSSSHLIHRPQP